MKIIVWLLAALMSPIAPAFAAIPSTPAGYQQLTSLSSASGFTPPSNATYCNVSVDSVANVAVRYRTDGVAPTASVGMEIMPGDVVAMRLSTFSKTEFIGEAAGAVLNIECYHDQ